MTSRPADDGEPTTPPAGAAPALPREGLWPSWRAERILHEDADLIVVDKPAGVSTHAQEPDRIDDAHSRVRAYLAARGDAEAYLGIHQRLERDTSGVLLFTRRKEANPAVARQVEGRTVERIYVAAVSGFGDRPPRGTLRHRFVPGEGGAMRALPVEEGPARGGHTARPGPRGDQGASRKRHAAPVNFWEGSAGRPGDQGASRKRRDAPQRTQAGAARGEEAITQYKLLARRGDRALLELRPEIGRPHQIRAELAAVGLPVAGDRLHGGPPARRLLLHAAALSLAHPATGARVTFKALLPPEIEAWLSPDVAALDAAAPFADAGAIERVMREAAELRYGVACAGDTTAFRLVHGGGDGLPGVSVDLYGEHLVVALFGEPAERAREAVLDAAHRLGARGVYLKIRPKHASVIVDPRSDAYAPREPSRGEPAPEAFPVLELGLPYEVRLGEGLSTGIFLDQRENRRRVRELARGARVLNLFAYSGAFTVAAAAGGARASVSVDVSRAALAWARRNLDVISAAPAEHVLIEADVFPWLKAAARAGEQFDLVVLDPPSFATTKKTRFSAESDYAELAELALRVLAPGGRLLACTNHRGISRHALRRRLHEAARAAGCALAQMKDLQDPVDFPPEPEAEPHLKSVLVTVNIRGSAGQAGCAPGPAKPPGARKRGAR